MQQNDNIVSVRWDCDNNDDNNGSQTCIHTLFMNPQYPRILYPLQKFNEYGSLPYLIPIFSSTRYNTSMIWMLCAILTRVEEIWKLVTNVKLFQSKWHGWILTYVAKKFFTHLKYRAKKGDPYRMNFMQNVDDVYSKIVSLFKIIFIIIHHNSFAIKYKKNLMKGIFVYKFIIC